MKKLLFISLLFLVGFSGIAQQITFQKIYYLYAPGVTYFDYAYCSIIDSDNNIVTIGESSAPPLVWTEDIFLLKTDENGNVIWHNRFQGPLADKGRVVHQTADGGYLLGANTQSYGSGNYDISLIKVDNSGVQQWAKAYGGTATDGMNNFVEIANNEFVIVGNTLSIDSGNGDLYVIKADINGDTLWTRAIGGNNKEIGKDIQQTSDGGFVMVGYTTLGPVSTSDIYIVKIDSNGSWLWSKKFIGGDKDKAYSVVETNDQGLIIVGSTESFGSGEERMLILKTDNSGNILWSKTYYSGTDIERAGQVLQLNNGDLLIAGSVHSFIDGTKAVCIKLDNNGNIKWAKAYGNESEGTGSIVVKDDVILLSGSSSSIYPQNVPSTYIIKTDTLGQSGCFEDTISFTVQDVSLNEQSVIDSVSSGGTVSSISFPVFDNTGYDTTLCFNKENVREPDTTDIDDALEFAIFPNPTTGLFTVQGATAELQVYDLIGRLVLRSNEEQIDMSNYPAGLYIWSVGSNRGKLVKE